MADEKNDDPIASMFVIEDEAERGKPLAEAELNTEAPADKAARERDEAGKFKGKEEDKPKVEAKAEEKPAEKPAEKPLETVPLAKYMEEKRALRAELEARDLTIKQINDRLAAFEKANAPAPAPEPDFVEDPKAYVDHKLKSALDGIAEANKKLETQGKTAQETAAQANEQVQLQQFMGELQQRERAFVAENPDYYDALAHLRGVRAAQLKEFSPEITDDQVAQTIRNEELQLAVTLHRQGRNPMQTALNLAKNFGYQKKAAAAPAPVVAKLPEPASNRLPPDQTLGSGAGAADTEPADDAPDAIDIALGSLFPKRRAG